MSRVVKSNGVTFGTLADGDELTDLGAAPSNGHGSTPTERERVVAEAARLITIEDEAQELARDERERSKPKAKPFRRRKADIARAAPVEWAWRYRIALEYLTLLIGEEGIGKGTLIPWVIARLTRGTLPGDLKGIKTTVAVVADEDDFDRVWTPRLYAAKANLKRVEILEPPGDGYITLGDPRLTDAVEQSGAKFVYLDSLVDNLGGAVNDWNAKQLRQALRPAKRLAKDLGVAVVGTLHTNKGGESARQLTPGSHQYGAVARGSIFLFNHPDEPGRTLLVHEKSNHARRPRALSFEIDTYNFEKNGRHFDGPLAVDMRDAGELSASEAIAEIVAIRKAEQHPTKVAELENLLRELLPNDGKRHDASPIVRQCEKQGHAARNVTRARDKLGIYYGRREGVVPACVEWWWPTTAGTTATPTDVRSGRSGRSGKTHQTPTTATTATTDAPIRGRSGGRTGGKKPKREAL